MCWKMSRGRVFFLVMLAFGLVGMGASAPAWAGGAKDVYLTVKASPDCTTFAKALKAAGLDVELEGNGPYTVFAPTDDAFKNLANGSLDELMKPENSAELKEILNNHIVKGRILARHLAHMDWVLTMNGDKELIRHKKGQLHYTKKANITKTDIPCSNGVIHVIDRVIMN